MKAKAALVLLLALWGTTTARGAEWHHPLYLHGGGYWRQRATVSVRNDMAREAAGTPVALALGQAPGQVPLIGQSANAVRVCNEAGVEMLYRIAAPDGRTVTRGPIPADARLVLPVECPAGATATYYVYSGNPAAWPVPDHLEAILQVRNPGVEQGQGDVPTGWRHDRGDEQHRAAWGADDARSGRRSLKTVVAPGAEPSWISTRQSEIHVFGGAEYVLEGWVKAHGVEGSAGWYIHVGNDDDPMAVNRVLSAGEGTYDWRKVTSRFSAPAEATTASLGTVLRGTGTAWFDDVTLTCASPPRLAAQAVRTETMELTERPAGADWLPDPPGPARWDARAPVSAVNLSERRLAGALVHVDVSRLTVPGRFRNGTLTPAADGRPLPHYVHGNALLFTADVPGRSASRFHLCVSEDAVEAGEPLAQYGHLLQSEANLARNPSFERGAPLPERWPGSAEGQRPGGTQMGVVGPGLFGSRCVRTHVPHGAQKAWTGWRQDVPVRPGATYFYAAWVRCEDVRDGSVAIHAHYRNAAGELCESRKHASAGPSLSGTTDWTFMSGTFRMPPDAAVFQLHLTMEATGTVLHDGVLLAEVLPGTLGGLEPSPHLAHDGPAVWPVNAVVKVFPDDVPPRRIAPARISCARNETEPLQLAVQAGNDPVAARAELEPPLNPAGRELTDAQVSVVGYVPIDHRTNYYSSTAPAWHRMFPAGTGGCDGWPGQWPDPLLPQATLELAAGQTGAVWLTVDVPEDQPAGDYEGRVRLVSGGRTLAEAPFTVHVWDFALPEENHVSAIYDLRLGGRWDLPGRTQREERDRFLRFMAERRLSADRIRPEPIIRYEDGRVVADFAAYDEAAEYYFDELGMRHAYTPGTFYGFGWGHPPRRFAGEDPYEGGYPYEGADRSRLRPEYKRAYQACLRAYWEHMKQRGWADRVTLYISDEPHVDQPGILEQMKALCDMIHEVDADIPIYSSTWRHIPEWDGYLDVWGIGHVDHVPVEEMRSMREGGARLWFTTDGQMCTDTPYCAVERLLPHYCFHYGVEAYEFWGISWLTYDPYEFGWHSYIRQSSRPGEWRYVRYPNGDGFLAYPGAPIGHDGPVSSVRLEQAREGVEDYEYLHLLARLIEDARAAGRNTALAERTLEEAAALVAIPNAGGRYSSRILPGPDAVLEVRAALARAIESLSP
jgi:hypothetical protein